MDNKRAVITGIGVVSSIGIGKENFWKAILEMKSGIDTIDSFDTSSFPSKIAAEIKNFSVDEFVDPKKSVLMDRSVQFAVVAAKMAKEDAKLLINKSNEESIHVIMGTAIGGLIWVLQQQNNLLQKGLKHVHAYSASIGMANSCSAEISIELGVKGPSETFSVGCASSHSALGYALKKIRYDEAKIVFVGGADAPIYPLPFGSLCVMKVLSCMNKKPKEACKPFDAKRDGMVLGEGAAVLVVEELEHAKRRGADIHAEVSGFGTTCDSYHIVHSDGNKCMTRAIEIALKDSNINKEEISFINAHGLAIKKSDLTEARAIKDVFSNLTKKIPVISIKSMVGHPLAAAGSMQFAVSALSIKSNIMPATLNYKNPDLEFDLNINREVRGADIKAVICNSFAFGGKNSCIVLKKYQ